jgi:hypothetical protein
LIRELATASDSRLVDVQRALASASRDGIIGADLMLEHVHPNAEGYFRLASAYVPAMTGWLGPPSVAVDDETARREMPLTEVDRLHGEYRVAVLKNDWPFVPVRRATTIPPPANRIEEIAQAWFAGQSSWMQAMNDALAEYQRTGNFAEAARVAVNLADAVVTSAEAQHTAGRLLLRAESPARGLHYLQRAVELDGASVEIRLSLAQAQFMLGNVAGSIATLEAILAAHPEDSRAKYWLAEMRSQRN